jgi:hypothetical protein
MSSPSGGEGQMRVVGHSPPSTTTIVSLFARARLATALSALARRAFVAELVVFYVRTAGIDGGRLGVYGRTPARASLAWGDALGGALIFGLGEVRLD